MTKTENKPLWWHQGIIYQIYPRSFQDSNGDGVGDLRGIIDRLDYLKWLGIEAIWISPIYPSPMADFGYDISDYEGIHPLFGDFNDFDDLLSAAHTRGIKMILDLVPNHTSDQHPWFKASKSSRDNPKRDWYLWKDAREDRSFPNNWLSVFGGSAWEWDENTEQYYYHGFLKEQPDLNWRNPEVQEAMLDVMRFWLDKGVDGFRVDVIWHMVKDKQWRDNPVNPDYQPYMSDYDQLLPVFSTDQPEVHDIIRKMRGVLDNYVERMMIGEIYLPIPKLMSYYGIDNSGAHLPFNFQLLTIAWDAQLIAKAIDEYEGALPDGGWPNWILSNHDQPRIASRVGGDQAKVAAVMLLTLRGTPTIYYGDEIGMKDVPIPLEEVQDPQGLNMPDKHLSRDPARTPMQWDKSNNAGFTKGKPWLRIDRKSSQINVETQKTDDDSFLRLYKRLIQLRQKEKSLMFGNYTPVVADRQMIVYYRQAKGFSKFMVALNLSHRPCYFHSTEPMGGVIEFATSPELEGHRVSGNISLSGDEAIIIRIDD